MFLCLTTQVKLCTLRLVRIIKPLQSLKQLSKFVGGFITESLPLVITSLVMGGVVPFIMESALKIIPDILKTLGEREKSVKEKLESVEKDVAKDVFAKMQVNIIKETGKLIQKYGHTSTTMDEIQSAQIELLTKARKVIDNKEFDHPSYQIAANDVRTNLINARLAEIEEQKRTEEYSKKREQLDKEESALKKELKEFKEQRAKLIDSLSPANQSTVRDYPQQAVSTLASYYVETNPPPSPSTPALLAAEEGQQQSRHRANIVSSPRNAGGRSL